MSRAGASVALGLALVLCASPVPAQDIFTGTLHVDPDGLRLRRCDLTGTTYLLRDAESAATKPVLAYLGHAPHLTGVWVAAVIGEYESRGDADGLRVLSIDNLHPGPSCHLMDALDALGAGTPQ